MSDLTPADPVTILRGIEAACRLCNTANLQQSDETFSDWSGIAFRVGNNNLLAPLDAVVEILEMPRLARVPLAQPWVLGIANIRGNLLPVVDISVFLGGEETSTGSKSRVLVIDHNGVYSGLVVDEVYGLKHFMESESAESSPDVDEFLLQYVSTGFRRDGKEWREFSLTALAETPQFMLAAV